MTLKTLYYKLSLSIWIQFFTIYSLRSQNRIERVLEKDSIYDGKDHQIILQYPQKFVSKTIEKKNNISHLNQLPKYWIPLYNYQDTLCTYKPCDGIFQFHIEIAHNKLSWINFDENISFHFIKLVKISEVEWKILLVENTKIPIECELLKIPEGYFLMYEGQIYLSKESTHYFH